MEKQIIKRRILECEICRQKMVLTYKFYDLDYRIARIYELRNKFSDVIPISKKDKENCIIYINALENEDFEICSKFLIID